MHLTKLALAVVAAAVLPSCMAGKHTYSYPTGSIPVVFTNNNNFPICMIDILPPADRKYELPWNPLKLEHPPQSLGGNETPPEHEPTPVPPGQSVQVSIEAGTYTFESSSCDQMYSGTVNVAVSGPVMVGIGPNKPNAPAGTLAVALPVVIHTVDTSCIPDGQWREGAGYSCCSSVTHYSRVEGREVCGP